MKKVFKQDNGGKVKRIKNRFGGDHTSRWEEPSHHEVFTRILDHEAREEALVEGYHPAATVVPTLEPVDLRNTVVSCGLSRDDDTGGNVGHIFIPVHVPKSSGSCSHRKVASKPPIRREFHPKKRQLMPIDHAIRRSA
ncbi:MAG: hypothetical protein WCW66_04220 [Patescibacteria group bacterium]